MKKRYSRSARGTTWRKGVFSVSKLPRVDEEDTVFARSDWGRPLRFLVPLDGGFKVTLTFAPEGVVFSSNCEWCGGQIDSLLDMRGWEGPVPSGDPASWNESRSVSLIMTRHEQWAAEHVHCGPSAGPTELPSTVDSFCQRVIGVGRTFIRAGKDCPTYLHLLFDSGAAVAMPYTNLPDEESERIIERAARQFAVRQYIRSRGEAPIAAVWLGEAWSSHDPAHARPSADPAREEVLVCGVQTPRVSLGYYAPIHRSSGIPGLGHGTVGEMERHAASSAATEGMLARAY